MKKDLFKYIFNEGPIKTSSILKSDRREDEPLLPGIEEPDKQTLLKNLPTAREDYRAIRKKEIKRDMVDLKKKKNELIKLAKAEQEPQPLLFDRKITTINTEADWKTELIALNKMIRARAGLSSDKQQNAYAKSLKLIINKFFSLGLKIPKRRLYIPLTRNNNFSQIDNLNKRGYYDMMINIKRSQFVDLEEIDKDIIAYLEKFGYQLTKADFFANRCRNKNNKQIPIDMELKKIQDIDVTKKKAFLAKTKDQKLIDIANEDIDKRDQYESLYLTRVETIKNYLNIMLDKIIIITWSPLSILSQSTGTQWHSCMTYEEHPDSEVNVRFIPPSINNGVFIAWLVDIDDKKIMKPIARTLLKPRKVELGDNKTRIAWWPSRIYTSGGQKNVIDLFSRTVSNYMLYKQKNIFNIEKHSIKVTDSIYNKPGLDGETYRDKEEEVTIVNFNAFLNIIKKETQQKEYNIHYLAIRYINLLNSYDIDGQKIKRLIEDEDFLKLLKDVLKQENVSIEIESFIASIFEKIANIADYKLLNLFFSKLNKKETDNFITNVFSINVNDRWGGGVGQHLLNLTFNRMIEGDTFINYFLNTYFFKRLENDKEFLESCVKRSRFLLKIIDNDNMFFKLIKTDSRFIDLKDADYGVLNKVFNTIKNFDIFKIIFEANEKVITNEIKEFFKKNFTDVNHNGEVEYDIEKKKQFLRYILIEKNKNIGILVDKTVTPEKALLINDIFPLNDFDLIRKVYREVRLESLYGFTDKFIKTLFRSKTEKEYKEYYDLFISRPETKFEENYAYSAMDHITILLHNDKKDKVFFKNLYQEFLDRKVSRIKKSGNDDAVFYATYNEYKNLCDILIRDTSSIVNNLLTGQALKDMLSRLNKDFFENPVFEALSKNESFYSIRNLSQGLKDLIDNYQNLNEKARNDLEVILEHFLNIFPDMFAKDAVHQMLVFIYFDINILEKMQMHEADAFLDNLITSPFASETKIDFFKKIIKKEVKIYFSKDLDKHSLPTGISGFSTAVFHYFLKCINANLFKGIKKEIPSFYFSSYLYGEKDLLDEGITVANFINELKEFKVMIKKEKEMHLYGDFIFSNKDNFNLSSEMFKAVIKNDPDMKEKIIEEIINGITLQNMSEYECKKTIKNMLDLLKVIGANDEQISNGLRYRLSKAPNIRFATLNILNNSDKLFSLFISMNDFEEYVTNTLKNLMNKRSIFYETLSLANFMVKIFRATNLDKKEKGKMLAESLGYYKNPTETLINLKIKLSVGNYQILKSIFDNLD